MDVIPTHDPYSKLRQSAINGPTSVRLKVKQWQLFREAVLVDLDFLLRKGPP